MESEQYDERERVDYDQCNKNGHLEGIQDHIQVAHVFVYEEIAFWGVAVYHGRDDSDDVLFKIFMVISHKVLGAACFRRIEGFDCRRGGREAFRLCRSDQAPVPIYEPYGGI